MDPVGKQMGSFPKSKAVLKQRLGEVDSWESNAPSDLGGGFNKRSGTRKADNPYDKWKGKVKGKITHTYLKGGKGDPE